MMLLLNGIITVLTTVIAIRELGLVKLKNNNSWVKLVVVELIGMSLVLILGHISEIFLNISIIFLIGPLIVILIKGKNSIAKTLMSVITVSTIIVILDGLIYPACLYIGEPFGFTEESILIRVISDIMIFISSFLISKISRKFFKKQKHLTKENKIKVSYSVLISIISLIIITVALIKVTIGKYQVDNKFIILSIFLAGTYLILISLIVYLIYKGLKKELINRDKQREIKDIMEYASRLENVSMDMRGFRSDYIKILSNMLEYINIEDKSGLEEFLKNKIIDLRSKVNKKNSSIELLYNIKLKEIKAIMISKVLNAQEIGLDVFVEIPEEIHRVNMEVLDFCICLSIILDNAIEGSKLCNEGSIKIGFVKKEKALALFVVNSVEGDIAPVYKMFEDGFSTKGEDRGTGLTELRNITSKYPNVYLETKIEGGVFSQILELE